MRKVGVWPPLQNHTIQFVLDFFLPSAGPRVRQLGPLEVWRLGLPETQRVGLVYLFEGEVPIRFMESGRMAH